MRIATSTVYNNQTLQLDNLEATYQQYGAELSSGKSLNQPSDNPTVIAQDLAVRNDSAVTTQIGQNLTNLNSQLTSVDGALSSLTSVLQSARSLAVQGASDTYTTAQRQALGTQVNQLLQEAIGLANTQYGGAYVFAGSQASSSPLVTASGSPISSVTSQGNNQQNTEQLPNGEQVTTGVTLQQAFNYGATNGSTDVFQTLINLRNTLNGTSVVDESAQQVNVAGAAINPAVTTIANLAAAGSPLAIPLTLDSTGQVSINIANGQSTSGVTVTIPSTDTVQQAINAINAVTGPIGVTASFNAQTQRLSFTGGAPFQVTDVASPGATNTGNFTTAFGITSQATTVTDLSTQLGALDNVLQVATNARAVLGSTITAAQSLTTADATQVNNDTTVQSGLEDTDIAKVLSEFSATQTALQAAYGTTTRLEQQSLWNYLQ